MGIDVATFSANTYIAYNLFDNITTNGIYLSNQNENNIIYSNIFRNLGGEIICMGVGIPDISCGFAGDIVRSGIGIYAYGHNNNISKNNISNANLYGVYFEDPASNNEVYNNNLLQNYIGLASWGQNNTIQSNRFNNGTYGIYIQTIPGGASNVAENHTIIYNEIMNNSYGLLLYETNSTNMTGNKFI
jgi:parallel beta-helix repeat protein